MDDAAIRAARRHLYATISQAQQTLRDSHRRLDALPVTTDERTAAAARMTSTGSLMFWIFVWVVLVPLSTVAIVMIISCYELLVDGPVMLCTRPCSFFRMVDYIPACLVLWK